MSCFKRALYGANWKEDIETGDETLAEGRLGRVLLLPVLVVAGIILMSKITQKHDNP